MKTVSTSHKKRRAPGGKGVARSGAHPTVRVDFGTRSAAIDVAMAPLVLQLWRLGIDTLACCQRRDDGNAYILFPTVAHARAFLCAALRFDGSARRSIARLHGTRSLYWRALDYVTHERGRWTFELQPLDRGLCEPELFTLENNRRAARRKRPHAGVVDVDFRLTVRFPAEDIPALCRNVTRFAEARGLAASSARPPPCRAGADHGARHVCQTCTRPGPKHRGTFPLARAPVR